VLGVSVGVDGVTVGVGVTHGLQPP
jgi:hypothetical protein